MGSNSAAEKKMVDIDWVTTPSLATCCQFGKKEGKEWERKRKIKWYFHSYKKCCRYSPDLPINIRNGCFELFPRVSSLFLSEQAVVELINAATRNNNSVVRMKFTSFRGTRSSSCVFNFLSNTWMLFNRIGELKFLCSSNCNHWSVQVHDHLLKVGTHGYDK